MCIERFMMTVPPKGTGNLSHEHVAVFNKQSNLVALLLWNCMSGMEDLKSDIGHTVNVLIWMPDGSFEKSGLSVVTYDPNVAQVHLVRDAAQVLGEDNPRRRADILLEWLVEALEVLWRDQGWPVEMVLDGAALVRRNDFSRTLSYPDTAENPSGSLVARAGFDIQLDGMHFWVGVTDDSGEQTKVEFAKFPVHPDLYLGRNFVFGNYDWIDEERFKVRAEGDFEEWIIDFGKSPPTVDHTVFVETERYRRRRHLPRTEGTPAP